MKGAGEDPSSETTAVVASHKSTPVHQPSDAICVFRKRIIHTLQLAWIVCQTPQLLLLSFESLQISIRNSQWLLVVQWIHLFIYSLIKQIFLMSDTTLVAGDDMINNTFMVTAFLAVKNPANSLIHYYWNIWNLT